MVETTSLHTKHTADNSQFKAAMQESIGLTDKFGNQSRVTRAIEQQSHSQRIASLKQQASLNIKNLQGAHKLSTAFKGQAMSVDQVTAASNRLAAGMNKVKTAGAGMNATVRTSRFHTSNLAAQINDIGVMTLAGQSPLILAAQQGTQINQVFGAMGGKPIDNLKALGAGIMQVVSPMSLLTIGVLAGGVALVQWGMKAWQARDAGEDFDDVLNEINTTLKESDQLIEAYRRGLSGIQSLAVDDEIRRIREEVFALENAIASVESMDMSGLSDSVARQNERLDGMREELAIRREQLKALETRNEREAEAKRLMEEHQGVIVVTKGVLEGAVGVMETLTGLSKNLADNAWDAKDGFLEAVKAMGIANLAAEQSQLGRGGMGAGGPTDAAGQFIARTGGQFITRDSPNTGRGGGGSDTGLTQFNSAFGSLQEELQSPLEALKAEQAERQKILAEAYERERINKEQHDSMLLQTEQMHQKAMTEIAQASWQNKLSAVSGVFGDLATLANSENKKLAEVGRAAGLVQIGIDGVSAASSAWKKGMEIGGPPVAAAFAGASVIKTAALMQQMRSNSPNAQAAVGGGGGGSGGGNTIPEATGGGGAQRPAINVTLYGDTGFTGAQIDQLMQLANDQGDNGTKVFNVRGRR